MNTPTILTGDRPTGPLHLGHFVGSLRQRVALQQTHNQFVLIADLQGLTDNGSNPQKIRDNIPEVLADYLAAGIDPNMTTICLQSARHAERNIDHFRHARDPAFVDHAAIAGRGNIVEHQLICAFIGIAFCQH